MSTLGGAAQPPAANKNAGATLGGPPAGATLGAPPAGATLGGPPAGATLGGASLGGPPAGASLGGPPKGASLGGPPPGATLGAPPAGATLGAPATGASLGGPPKGASLGGPPAATAAADASSSSEAGGESEAEKKKNKKKKKPAAADKGPDPKAAQQDGAKGAKGAKAPAKGGIGKKLAEAMQKKKELEDQMAKEAEEQRLREIEEEKKAEEERKRLEELEKVAEVEREAEKKRQLEEERKRKLEAERMEKLKSYGIKVEKGHDPKADAQSRIAAEQARKVEAEKKRQEELEAAKKKQEEEEQRKKEEEARAAELANAPLVDDWMAAAEDWNNINVDALIAKVPGVNHDGVGEAAAKVETPDPAAVAAADAKDGKGAAHGKNELFSDAAAHEEGSADSLRSPICCVLGHVDVGKTKLLDYMRKTHVQDGEAGGITQQIGATFFPAKNLEDSIQKVASRKKLNLEVPGLLIIDTPGHESFANLRSRGSGLCDLAILVVDLVVGLEKQTIESIGLLKMRRTPFVVALNKLDRVYEWKPAPAGSSAQNLKKQPQHVQQDFQTLVNRVIVQFAEQGLNAELYWKNKELKTTINMIPTSAHTGEGVPDLLMVITQITQKFLQERITFDDHTQATVLEVKPLEGLGTTVDVILVNGVLQRGDRVVLCGLNGAIVTQIKTILTPQPMRELRIRTPYQQHEKIRAAQGLKLLAPGHDLEKAVPGSPLIVVHNEQEEQEACAAVMEEFEKLRANISKDGTGVYVQSSTLGSLEALLHFLRESKIPVCDFGIGTVTKVDVIKAACMHERKKPEFACILAFDVKINDEAQVEARKSKVTLFTANIIYHLEESFTKYLAEIEEAKRQAAAEDAVFPCVLEILPEHIFNTKNPIIMGCRVLEGTLRAGTPIVCPSRKMLRIGKVVKIEANHQERQKASEGEEVAVSIDSGGMSVMYGRQFDHNDKLYSHISRRSINAIKEFFSKELTKDDIVLIQKLKKLLQVD